MNDKAADTDILSGLRVLIAEDEAAIALLIEDMLLDFGCELAGTVARVEKGLEVVAGTPVDFAILDLNLAGEQVHPLAEELKRRGTRFLVSTGYGDVSLGDGLGPVTVLPKPFTQRDLRTCMLAALRDGATESDA